MAQGDGGLTRRLAAAARAAVPVAVSVVLPVRPMAAVLALALALMPAGAAPAQEAPGAVAPEPPPAVRPLPRPVRRDALPDPAPLSPEAAEGPESRAPLATAADGAAADPGHGAVTGLALPRYVSLKTDEGNARRGPGLTHRIDWTFRRAGMPLRITAEFENWRRVEDAEGAGGWVHYSLLSGTRTVLVTEDMAEFRTAPQEGAAVLFQAEAGVIGRLMACRAAWCRVAADGRRGWVRKRAIWGVDPGEILD